MQLEKIILEIMCVFGNRSFGKIRKIALKQNRKWLAGRGELYRFSKGKLTINANKCDTVQKIVKGFYDYQYFNVCFLNNMFSFVLMSIAENKIPYISIINEDGENIWEWFFEQPYSDFDISDKKIEEYDKEYLEVFPDFSEVFSDLSIKMWGSLYQKFWKLNKTTKEYIDREVKSIIGKRKVLGVLCRGTDYTECKPKGHPIQPDIDQVILLAEQKMQELNCEYLYLATEDGRIDKKFRDVFHDKVLINQREYYDDAFQENQLQWIKDVHFERENDNYHKGLEYISSLVILSKCSALIGGNCGGSQTAVFLNNGTYEFCHIYDLGIYE